MRVPLIATVLLSLVPIIAQGHGGLKPINAKVFEELQPFRSNGTTLSGAAAVRTALVFRASSNLAANEFPGGGQADRTDARLSALE